MNKCEWVRREVLCYSKTRTQINYIDIKIHRSERPGLLENQVNFIKLKLYVWIRTFTFRISVVLVTNTLLFLFSILLIILFSRRRNPILH